jgi:hypothetical protein
MTVSTVYFTHDDKMLNSHWNKRRKSTTFRPQFATTWIVNAVSFALLLASLVAEITPLVLYWKDHIPVWHMSLMMFSAWAVVWWGTRIIAILLFSANPP